VVVAGERNTLEPETTPMPLLMLRVGAGEPETDHESVVDDPEVMLDGVASKDVMVGAEFAAGGNVHTMVSPGAKVTDWDVPEMLAWLSDVAVMVYMVPGPPEGLYKERSTFSVVAGASDMLIIINICPYEDVLAVVTMVGP
jgi:hypothetical protein